MNNVYTPKERAYRAAILAWLCVVGAFVFLLIVFVYSESAFLDFCLIASMVSAVIAILFGVYSLSLATSSRAWWATSIAALLLASYALLIYLMQDFCVIC